MNKLEIMNYMNVLVKTDIDLDDLSKIETIKITVLTGDEICDVWYTDGRCASYDSADDRIQDFYDGSYILYSQREGINLLEKFTKRKNSYTILWDAWRDE